MVGFVSQCRFLVKCFNLPSPYVHFRSQSDPQFKETKQWNESKHEKLMKNFVTESDFNLQLQQRFQRRWLDNIQKIWLLSFGLLCCILLSKERITSSIKKSEVGSWNEQGIQNSQSQIYFKMSFWNTFFARQDLSLGIILIKHKSKIRKVFLRHFLKNPTF